MTAGPTHNRLGRRWWLLAVSVLACFALAACGPLGDDEADPTATSETIAQPTDEATLGVTDEVTVTESGGLAASTPVGTPVVIEGTPDLEPVTEAAATEAAASTPVFNDVSASASPAAIPSASPIAQTPAGGVSDLPVPDGDGTSGALPETDGTPTDTSLLVAETPVPAAGGTPSSSPVALAGSLAELDITSVSTCELETVPPIALESTAFTTTTDVNIRVGPGADCEALPISPVGAFLPVTVIGGPVQREGEDLVWVQVEVAGETGWVVTAALEPAAS